MRTRSLPTKPILTENELLARDAQHDLNTELLEAAHQIQAGKLGRVSLVTHDQRVAESPVANIRMTTI